MFLSSWLLKRLRPYIDNEFKVLEDRLVHKISLLEDRIDELIKIVNDVTQVNDTITTNFKDDKESIQILNENMKIITKGLRGIYTLLEQVISINTKF